METIGNLLWYTKVRNKTRGMVAGIGRQGGPKSKPQTFAHIFANWPIFKIFYRHIMSKICNNKVVTKILCKTASLHLMKYKSVQSINIW